MNSFTRFIMFDNRVLLEDVSFGRSKYRMMTYLMMGLMSQMFNADVALVPICFFLYFRHFSMNVSTFDKVVTDGPTNQLTDGHTPS